MQIPFGLSQSKPILNRRTYPFHPSTSSGRTVAGNAAVWKFVSCPSSHNRITTRCCGPAISISCAVRIPVYARNGRASLSSGRYTRSTMRCTGKSCKPFSICMWSVWTELLSRQCKRCGKLGTMRRHFHRPLHHKIHFDFVVVDVVVVVFVSYVSSCEDVSLKESFYNNQNFCYCCCRRRHRRQTK